MGKSILAAAVVSLMAGCGSSTVPQRLPEPSDICGRRIITRNELGEKWPLTVDSGEISRTRIGACFFTHNGVKYALNGIARGGIPRNGSEEITPIWRPNPEYAKYQQPGQSIVRIDIGDLIAEARKLCR